VTGTPVITLNTTPIRTWIYVSWSGEATLLFQYTVIDWDTATGLDYASTTALDVNGWTIQNGSGEDATLTLANPWDEHSLWYNTDIVIDTTKPTCTFDYNPTSWTVVNTDVIAICIPSEPVTYQQPSWTGVYIFTESGSYEFQFTDNAWNTWSSTATVYWIDKTSPKVINVTSTDNGTHSWWNIDITVEFDEIVFVTGAPTITLNTTPIRTWNYLSWSWTTILTFRYTIESWDTSTGLDYASTTALALNGWTIKDAATNDAVLALASPWTIWSLWYNKDIVIDAKKPTCTFTYNPDSWPVNTDVIATCTPSESVTYQQPSWTGLYTFTTNGSYEFKFTDNAWNTWSSTATVDWIDKTAPTVTNVSATTADWHYKAWKDIDITVTFSETVYVTGTPVITLNTTPTARTWNYVSWSGTDTLTFRYTVMSWDYSADLDYVSTTALVLNGWTIIDAATNNATLTLVAPWTAWSLWANKAIVIDTEAPTLSGKTTFGTGWYTWDQISTFTYTDNVWIVSWTPVTCDITGEWTVSFCSVAPNVCDAAWNCNTTTQTSNTIKLDKTAPVFSGTNSFGASWYNSNQTATFTYTDDVAPIVSWNPTCTITEWTASTCSVTPNVCNEAWLCNTTPQTSNPANVDTSAPSAPTVTCSNFTHNTPLNYTWEITCSGTNTTWPSPLIKVEISMDTWATWIDNWTSLSTWFTPVEWFTNFMMRLYDTWWTWASSTAYTIIKDLTAPVVTLVGDATVTLRKWWTYTELWATWTDAIDGTWVASMTGTVDTGTIWTYILEYRHTDTAWNKSDTVTRTVTVRVKKVTSSKEEQLSTGQTEPEVLDDETSEKTLDELVGDYMEKYKDNPEKLKQLETAMKSAKDSDVDQELKDAYVYAFLNGITTQATIEKAELDRGITRAEMAKMMAVFATKISDKERVKTGIVKYADVDSSLGDLADYILLAYQLQIMGIDANGNPIENFNPHAEVTRAEFATVLSRILYGNKYNQQGSDFYSKHLQALKNASILKNTTPTMKELRGWVMLMLYRS